MILIFIACLILFQAVLLGACTNNGWKLVSSITITTSGTTKTFSSGISNHFGASMEVTQEEYSKNKTGRDLDSYDDKSVKRMSISEVSKKTKGGTSYSYCETLLKGYWYYRVFRPDATQKLWYMKKPYTRTAYSLVYVKIINNSTIKIKTSKGETTYTVTSYSIHN